MPGNRIVINKKARINPLRLVESNQLPEKEGLGERKEK